MGIVNKAITSVTDKVLFRGKDSDQPITDTYGSDPQALASEAGPAGRVLIKTLDKAVHLQSSAIIGYVDWLRSRNPEASPQEIQRLMDKHFMRLATGTGAGAGTAAAVPGIGFITGAVAVSAESLVFLDAAAFYTVASAYLRGGDIRDPERRKALILVAILGSSGSALADASINAGNSVAAISRLSVRNLGEVNNQLLRMALNQVSKRLRTAWIGKIMPMGVGAVLGTVANRKLASKVVNNTNESLGPLPATFSSPAPSKDSVPEPTEIAAAALKD